MAYRGKLPISITDEHLPYEIHVVDVFNVDLAAHDAYEFLMVLDGEVRIQTEAYDKLLTPNEVVFINSRTIHRFHPINKQAKLLVLYIDRDYVRQYMNVEDKELFFVNDLEHRPQTKDIKIHLIKLYLNIYRDQYTEASDSVEYLLDSLKENFIIDNNQIIDSLIEGVDEVVQSIIIDISIRNEIVNELSLADYADKYDINYFYLSKLFKETTGINFTEYTRNIRLYQATLLIIKSNRSIADIAKEIGYADTKAMGRDFIKVFQMSPSAFRKHYQGLAKEDHKLVQQLEYTLEQLQSRQAEDIPTVCTFYYMDLDKPTIKRNQIINDTVLDLKQIYHNSLTMENIREIKEDINLGYLRLHLKMFDNQYCLFYDKNARRPLGKNQVLQLCEITKTLDISLVLVFHQNIDLESSHYVDAIQKSIEYMVNRFGMGQAKQWQYEFFFENAETLSSKVLIDHFLKQRRLIQNHLDTEDLHIGMNLGHYFDAFTDRSRLYDLLLVEEIHFISLEYTEHVTTGRVPKKAHLQQVLREIHNENALKKPILLDITYILDNNRNLMSPYNEVSYCLLQLENYLASPQEYYLVNWKIKDAIDDYQANYISEYGVPRMSYYFNAYASLLYEDIIYQEPGITMSKNKTDDEFALLLYTDYRKTLDNDIFTNCCEDNMHEIHIKLRNLSGEYRLIEYQIDFKKYFFYHEWLHKLDVNDISSKERELIRGKLLPDIKVHYLKSRLDHNLLYEMSPIGFKIIVFKKIGK